MFEHKVKALLDLLDVLVQWSFLIHSGSRRFTENGVPDLNRNEMIEQLDKLLPSLREPELDMCRLGAERLRDTLKQTNSHKQICSDVDDLRRRILDEAGRGYCLMLSSKEKEEFEPPLPPFGKDFPTKFGSADYDVNEASKCLALGRSTAAAFHSIRCLEAGIRALSRCLAVPDPTRAKDRNWGAMLGVLKDAIDAKWPGSSERLSGDGEFFDNAFAGLAAMQNPWRNATMHLDQKYTSEEAYHIFEVVKGFMKKVASRMDENGDPKA